MIKLSINSFTNTTDSFINWTNSQGKCIDPLEMVLKNLYVNNYLFYIRNPQRVGSIIYDVKEQLVYNRLILNTYLYEYPGEPLTRERIEGVIKNIIDVCHREHITSLSIPCFKTNSNISQEEVENIIVNMFYTFAPDVYISLYVFN